MPCQLWTASGLPKITGIYTLSRFLLLLAQSSLLSWYLLLAFYYMAIKIYLFSALLVVMFSFVLFYLKQHLQINNITNWGRHVLICTIEWSLDSHPSSANCNYNPEKDTDIISKKNFCCLEAQEYLQCCTWMAVIALISTGLWRSPLHTFTTCKLLMSAVTKHLFPSAENQF